MNGNFYITIGQCDDDENQETLIFDKEEIQQINNRLKGEVRRSDADNNFGYALERIVGEKS